MVTNRNDAFAGRAPGSVLAKHYVDLSPSKLKLVYEQAELTVLAPPVLLA
ncbi:MAG: hypothetical protein KGI38_08900 [Thaumarchaeota archaeon]|nr:hypothetical protein [Nitrososphaerota archaeon]